MQHDWIKSTLGHGNLMCRRCCTTDLEAMALGIMEQCDAPPPKPANDDREWSQDEIDEQMFCDDEDNEIDGRATVQNEARLIFSPAASATVP